MGKNYTEKENKIATEGKADSINEMVPFLWNQNWTCATVHCEVYKYTKMHVFKTLFHNTHFPLYLYI
jgi:hypothetical protein